MRIGMLADIYKPHVSGVTHYISLNKKVLEERGHTVYVFTFGDMEFEDEEERVIRSPGVPVADTGIFLSFRHSSEARDLIRSMDILHVHHPFLSGRLALRHGRAANIPVVFTNHTRYDMYAQAYLPMLPDQIGSSFLQAYLPTFCHEVDLVIAPSEGLKQVLRNLEVNDPIEVIPNGVDLEPFMSDVPPVDRALHGIAEDDVVLIYTGRLGPEKNLTFLLRAFAGASGAYPGTRLILVGTGPESDNLVDLAEKSGFADRLIFTGLIDYDEMPAYLKMADLFVTASVTEVHPLSVVEALASGLPVIGIESVGVGDTVQNGMNGLLASYDLPAYTAKLTRAIADEDLRRSMSEAAVESARQYGIERTLTLVEEQYQRLISQPDQSRDRFWEALFKRFWSRVSG